MSEQAAETHKRYEEALATVQRAVERYHRCTPEEKERLDSKVTQYQEIYSSLLQSYESVRLSEAPSYGEPIESFDPMSRGAIAYRELGREFIQRHKTE